MYGPKGDEGSRGFKGSKGPRGLQVCDPLSFLGCIMETFEVMSSDDLKWILNSTFLSSIPVRVLPGHAWPNR